MLFSVVPQGCVVLDCIGRGLRRWTDGALAGLVFSEVYSPVSTKPTKTKNTDFICLCFLISLKGFSFDLSELYYDLWLLMWFI